MYLIHKKHSKERNICMSSFIPTLVGISEPAIFAANMRYSIIRSSALASVQAAAVPS